jgi:NADH-quinone oxidoreductase subunit N
MPQLNFRDFYTLAPEIVLAVAGLVVLLVDVSPLRRRTSADRQRFIGGLSMLGALAALLAALVPILVRYDVYGAQTWLNYAGTDTLSNPDPVLFFGTIASDVMTELFNLLLVVLLALVFRMSMAWTFTENWGEYFALLFWSTVGMMLLIASEDLLTLFLTLETMTICLYLCTAFEKGRRRSAEAGLKYFIYGSVSSALFLFGLSLIYGLTGSMQFQAIRQVMKPELSGFSGLSGNIAGGVALLLLMVGFGFKIAAVPFHQWAPDAYEGAPAPVTAWIATGSKIASFVALMKVLLNALGPWSNAAESVTTPGWIGLVAVLSAATMTFGNFAALAQRNLKRMLAYSSIAHAGYMLVGVAAAGVSVRREEAAGSVLFYLVIYAFSNIGAFAVAAWLARDCGRDDIDDLDGLGFRHPALATCILLLMLSLIGMPPLAGFFGKFYMFMEALDENNPGRLTLMWLVALGLLNSVISAFYYVRVLKAMFLRRRIRPALAPATTAISLPIVLATVVVVAFGLYPAPLMSLMKGAGVAMLSSSGSIGGRAPSGTSPDAASLPSSAGTETTPPQPTPVPAPAPAPSRTP